MIQIIIKKIQEYDLIKDHWVEGNGIIEEKSNLKTTHKLKMNMGNNSEGSCVGKCDFLPGRAHYLTSLLENYHRRQYMF